MPKYHPPKMITSNSAPAISADLFYEEHGKCGLTRVLDTNDFKSGSHIFDSVAEHTANAWKMIMFKVGDYAQVGECGGELPICAPFGAITEFKAANMETADSDRITGKYYTPFEIMADITYVELDYHMRDTKVILYLDCEQS